MQWAQEKISENMEKAQGIYQVANLTEGSLSLKQNTINVTNVPQVEIVDLDPGTPPSPSQNKTYLLVFDPIKGYLHSKQLEY